MAVGDCQPTTNNRQPQTSLKVSAPYFHIAQSAQLNEAVILDEANSKHLAQVLRMQPGEKVNLTDGRGGRHLAEIEALIPVRDEQPPQRGDSEVTAPAEKG